ncbi:MAG: hypothetical protein NT121_25505 [Chloroflexi bacterium]|nr:hypothetical protein [Chloroflexota bacterium]
MKNLFEQAEEFIWHNARLLERRLFDFHFRSGSSQAVLSALRAYQNKDGGFGNALEPDIRCPESQPVPTQHALEILDTIGFDEIMVQRICDFLLSITTEEGGVPFVLPSVRNYPHAPWWNTEDNPPASLNPTAILCGLLHKHAVHHVWLERSTAYCWEKIPGLLPNEQHEMGCVLTFLRYVPQQERAEKEIKRLSEHLLSSGLVAEAGATGYVRKALDWAPFPDDPLRVHFSEQDIRANLEEIVAGQQEDGGWGITWTPISPGCEMEWRGWVTVGALLRLQANGYSFERL